MLMPGRHGYSSQGGWATGEGENGLPGSLTVKERSDNEPPEYKATEQIEFIDGFESALGDVFEALITNGGSSGGSGSGVDGSDGGYRYGFNGKEYDNEVKGEGNQQDYGMRIYDPRLGKFLSVDPLQEEYPELTPYQFASNSPTQNIDLDGLEGSWYGWTKGLSPEARDAAIKGLEQAHSQIVNGTASGVKKSVTKFWSFISSDAWKASTWKNAGAFIEQGILGTSTVNVVETPMIDATVKDFEDKVINGNAYSRTEYFAELGTDFLLAKGVNKTFTVTKGMALAEKIVARRNFARSFYENIGGNVRDIEGINFSSKVSSVAIDNSTKLYQWTINGKLGDYFSPTSNAKNLGIPQMPDGTPAYFDKVTNALKPRTLVEVNLPAGTNLKGLKSTAADAKPWDGASGMNKGGDIQIYSPQVKTSGPTVTPIK